MFAIKTQFFTKNKLYAPEFSSPLKLQLYGEKETLLDRHMGGGDRHDDGLGGGRLGPLDAEDQVVVAVAVEGLDGLGRVLLLVVVDKGESLALVGLLVLGQVDPGDGPEDPEQVLQIALHHVLREVRHSDGCRVLGCKGNREI